jgi:uncharacterized protein
VTELAQDFLGRGWAFPIKLMAGGNRLVVTGGVDKVEQSIWLILSTAPGERQLRPEFGCGIHDLVFEPNTAALRGLVRATVEAALTRWEPRIDLLDVRVDTGPEQRNVLLVQIDYRLRENNAVFNLVYPFFLDEGAG